MSKRDFLRANTGVQDPLHFAVDNNVFAPDTWSTVNNHMQDRKRLTPKVTNGLGGTSSFSIAKVADCAGWIRLDLTLSALSGSGGSYIAWQDWTLYSLIDTVSVSYAGNRLQTLHGEDMVEKIKSFATEEEIATERTLAVGDQPLGARAVLAAGAQTVRGRLPLFFTSTTRNFLQCSSLAHEVTIDITYKTLLNSVETDHTASTVTGSITAQSIEVNYVHLTPADRAAVTAATTTDYGLLYSFLDIERQRSTLVSDASTTDFSIAVNSIRNPAAFLQVTLRKASALNSSTGQNRYYDYLSVGPLATISLTANGTAVSTAHTERELQNDVHNRYWPHAPIGENIYKIPFALDPSDKVHATGSLNIANTSNPQLELKFGTTLPALYGSGENIVVDIKGFVRQTIQHRAGDIQKNFA